MTETGWCTSDIVFVNNNLEKWMKDESAEDVPFTNKLLFPFIRKDPLGAVYIIGYGDPLIGSGLKSAQTD